MRSPVQLFRVLILASVALGLIGGVTDFVFPDLLPKDLNEAWESYTPEGMEWLLSEDADWISLVIFLVVILVFLALAIVSTIGLFLFKRWGRPVALWITVLSTITYPLFGATLYSGWALMLTQAAMLMWGAALAMAYFSDLRTRFES